MSEKQKSFVQGAAILSVAGLICRIIGALYRIPLFNILGSEGMAYYQYAYPVYNFLLVISSAGLPAAISKLVSERIAHEDKGGAYKIFRVSLKMLIVIGIATTIIMLAASGLIAQAVGAPQARFSYMAIAPALLFVSIISAYRGYFQGQQRMVPTAASQVIEQVGKLGVGFYLAYRFLPMGLEYGAAGALLGVSISEFIALICIVVTYRLRGGGDRLAKTPPLEDMGKQTDIAKRILAIAIPITLGASIMPLVNSIDSVMVTNRLIAGGLPEEEARSLYGLLYGAVASVVNMPAVITSSLSMSLVPAISAAFALRDARRVRTTTQQGLKIAWIIGMPCFAGICALGAPIVSFLYGSGQSMDAASVELGGNLLSAMSVSIMFLSVVQTTTGILQGFGKPSIPVRSLLFGALAKVVLNYILLAIPQINIYGASISSAACYLTAMTLNLIHILRLSHMRLDVRDTLLKPAAATAVMAVVVLALRWLLMPNGNYSRLLTLGIIFAGALIYVTMLLIVRAITPEDMKTMPGGSKITKLFRRLHIWK